MKHKLPEPEMTKAEIKTALFELSKELSFRLTFGGDLSGEVLHQIGDTLKCLAVQKISLRQQKNETLASSMD